MSRVRINQIPKAGPPVHLGDFFLEDRRFPAVYFLYHRGAVVYVGQSRTLKLRIDQHLEEGSKLFDAVAFIRCTVDQLSEIEAHYIKRLVPKYNACQTVRKARQRRTWEEPRRAKFAARSGEPIVTIPAAECIINPRDIGEVLQVSDADVIEWEKTGGLADNSLLGLLHFVAANSKKVSAAQNRFEDL